MAKAEWTKTEQALANLDLCAKANGQPVSICRVNDPELGILVKTENGLSIDETFLEKLCADPRFPKDSRVVVEPFEGNPNANVLVVGPDAKSDDAAFESEIKLPMRPKTIEEVGAFLASLGLCQ